MKNLFICLFLSLLIVSCSIEEEEQNYDVPVISTQKVYSVLDVSNAPDGRFSFGWTDGSQTLYVDRGVINYIAYGYQLTYTPLALFRYHHQLRFYPDTNAAGDYLLGCADVTVNTFHNDMSLIHI